MSEQIDLVNSVGEVKVWDVERNDAEKYDGLHMQIVIAVVFDSLGRVLIHKRSEDKTVARGHIDLICGGVASGETPEDAAQRETDEESGGIIPKSLRVIRQGVNPYDRYCYLLIGEATGEPDASKLDPLEVTWAAWHSVDELRTMEANGQQFVDGFFEDIETALAAK